MQSVSPVFTLEEVQFEREIAKNQPEYSAVIGLPITLEIIDEKTGESKRFPDWAIAIRFRLSDEERAAVAAGLDLVVTQLVFGKQLHPMNLQFCHSATKPVLQIAPEPPALPASEAHGELIEELESNVIQMPSAADLDAVAAEQEAANQTEQPAPAEDQPQSEV